MTRRHPFKRYWLSGIYKPELSRTFLLALPLMLGELSSMLMGVAGTMMTGRLGQSALAAIGIGNVVYFMSMLLVWGGIRMIPTPVAEAHELRDGIKVRTLILAGGWLALFFVVVCSILLAMGIYLFDLLGQDPEVAALAVSYLKIIVYSLPSIVLFAILVNYVDAFGFVRLTMLLSFAGLALDIFLNWIFIFGKLGMPALGINAIAINMGVTHAVSALVLLLVLFKHPELAYWRNAIASKTAILDRARTFIRLGIPSALQIMVEFAAFGAGTVIVGQISKTEQAAHQIAINLISVTYVTIMGISTAGMIRVGQALAYKSRVKVWLAGVSCILLALGFMTIPTAFFLLIPSSIIGLYISDPAVVGIGTTLLIFAGLFQMADAAQAASISLLRSLNDVLRPSLISFVAFWIIGLPLGYWLAIHQGWHAKGIWAGYLVALVIQATLFVQRFFSLVKRGF